MDKQTDTETDRQIGKYTDRRTHKLAHTHMDKTTKSLNGQIDVDQDTTIRVGK